MNTQSNDSLIDPSHGALVVGVLNVTPDSYFDGGKYTDEASIASHAKQMIADGAEIIDVGGESTGPGSEDVSEEEELQRVLRAIDTVKKAVPDAWISVDTYKASVAEQALQRGASMINDVTAGRGDPEMFSVIAKHNCPYVMMYAKDDSARTTVAETAYDDVLETITAFLAERIAAAKDAGISEEHIIIDPGLGHFVSSDPEYSFIILRHLERFAELAPTFVSPSRKSFLAGPQNLPPAERLPATLGASAIALEHGATFIRTHDVKETRQVIDALT